jgi:hypothetical protein
MTLRQLRAPRHRIQGTPRLTRDSSSNKTSSLPNNHKRGRSSNRSRSRNISRTGTQLRRNSRSKGILNRRNSCRRNMKRSNSRCRHGNHSLRPSQPRSLTSKYMARRKGHCVLLNSSWPGNSYPAMTPLDYFHRSRRTSQSLYICIMECKPVVPAPTKHASNGANRKHRQQAIKRA